MSCGKRVAKRRGAEVGGGAVVEPTAGGYEGKRGVVHHAPLTDDVVDRPAVGEIGETEADAEAGEAGESACSFVGVDEERATAVLRRGEGDVQGGDALAVAGCGGRDDDGLSADLVEGEAECRHREVVRLGGSGFGIRVGRIRPVRTDIRILGDDREERCVQDRGRRVAIVCPLVALGAPPRPRSGSDDTQHQGDRGVAHGPWLYLAAGTTGGHVELHAGAVDRRVRSELLDPGVERDELRDRRGSLSRERDVARFGGEFGIDLGDSCDQIELGLLERLRLRY